VATTFRLEHTFPEIPVELFEKYLNHPELIAMLKGMPGFRSRDLIERKDDPDGIIHWTFRVVAGGDVPASARKVVTEDMLTWDEVTRFVPQEHTIYWRIRPLKDRIKDILNSHGTWKLVPDGQGTRRIIDGHIEVKIPFVGKVAEAFLASELKRNYDVEPDLQRKFYRMMKERDVKA
jgi:hypothetical protein